MPLWRPLLLGSRTGVYGLSASGKRLLRALATYYERGCIAPLRAMQPLSICLALGRRGWGGLVMQMGVCLRHPVIMLYLCPHGRNSRPCPASRLLPCAVFLLFPHPFIPNDAVRCIGHRSALHWALQCTAQAVAVRCVFRCTFMHGQGHAAKLSFPEDRKQKCCAMGYTAQHCLPYTFVLSAQPA